MQLSFPDPITPSQPSRLVLSFIPAFPANAVDTVLLYNGPTFFGELSEDSYPKVNSFLDIVKLPEFNSKIPLWRRAYINQELECRDTEPTGQLQGAARSFGLHIAADTYGKTLSACGNEFPSAFFGIEDVLEPPSCTTGILKRTSALLLSSWI